MTSKEPEFFEYVFSEKPVIDNSKHKSDPVLTRYEYASLIAKRVEMLAQNRLLESCMGEVDLFEVAQKEIEDRKDIGIILKRTLPNGDVELWDIREMTLRKY